MFLRIDTHLSKNPLCKYNRSTEPTLQPEYQLNQQDQASSPQSPSIPTLSGEQVPPTPHYKPPIKLPTSDDEWELLQGSSSSLSRSCKPTTLGKNHILVEGDYSYFEAQYGTHPSPNKQNKVKRKKPNHDRALKKVSKLKNLARKEYRQSRSNGLPNEVIQALATCRNFIKLVRQHSQLKKRSWNASLSTAARKARDCCHKRFWQYAKELLDNNPQTGHVGHPG